MSGRNLLRCKLKRSPGETWLQIYAEFYRGCRDNLELEHCVITHKSAIRIDDAGEANPIDLVYLISSISQAIS